QEEFAAELATLRGRVDSLEARATTLEKQQFSTTTKLRGEAIFSFSGALGDSKAIGSVQQRLNPNQARTNVDENQTFSDRVRLSLATSFTGKDTLLTRLQARNITAFADATGTNMARLSYEGASPAGTPANNSVSVDKLYYRFPIGAGSVTVDAINGEFFNNVPNFNPLLANDGQGSISRFGRFNPIYRQGSSNSASGAGVTLNYPFGRALTVSLGYLADNASDPTNANGLFNGSNAALAQIAFKLSQSIDLGLTYVRSYDKGTNVTVTSGTGSRLANSPFASLVGTTVNGQLVRSSATSADQFGAEAAIRLTPGFTLAGWAGYTKARLEDRNANADADIWNWAVTLAFPDLGKKGNLAGIVLGQPPKVTNSSLGNAREDRDTSFHVEGLYRYQLNNNISITPGIIVIFNPENNSANDTVYVGTVRTTFTF
ncbi:MAG: iron uptake porin, partial [Phormidesmis sp. CAN_BIN44]|nr:iron uptake porin [Phormidesmis sp. CAN_BIN44]